MKKILSLFAGIGGFDLAFERAGFECAGQCEIDKNASGVLAHHWPNVRRWADIRELRGADVGPVDVITGGFPCQDLSVAGKRAGLAGGRSGLFYEMVRITNELQPSFLIWENVPGLLSSDNGRDFGRVLAALDNIGYCGAWTGFDARYFGLAQRRRRIFGVFARRDIGAGACAEILALRNRLRWHPATGEAAEESIAGTIGGGAAGRGWSDDTDRMTFVPQISATITYSGGNHGRSTPRGDGQDNLVAAPIQASAPGRRNGGSNPTAGAFVATPIPASYGKQLDNSDRNGGPPNLIVGSLTARAGRNGGASNDDVDSLRLVPTLSSCGNAHSGQRDDHAIVFCGNRTSGPLDVSPAINAHGGSGCMDFESEAFVCAAERTRADGRNLETSDYALNPGIGVRRLTPTECERLQGFADGWTATSNGKAQADGPRYQQLGNAVAVPVVEWIAKKVHEYE